MLTKAVWAVGFGACPRLCPVSYEYDLAERMRAVKQDGVELGSYKYDPFGRRTSKTVSGVTTYFYYDDTGLLAEYDGAGQLISEYQYKPGSTWMTNPLFKRDGASNKVHYYYNSHLGQPLKLFDKSGKTTWAGRSQAFGGTSVFVNEVENNLRFPGQYEDGESGLFYNFWRYYDSGVGRYLRSDPIGVYGGVNTFGYAYQNATSFYDSFGLWCLTATEISVISAALGGAVTGGIAGGFNPGAIIAGAAIGGGSAYLSSTFGGGVNASAGIGAAAGFTSGGGMVGGVVGGAISGGLGASSGNNTASGMFGGMVGGALQKPSRLGELGMSFKGSPGGNMLKGGWAGMAGGFVQDLAAQALEDMQDCGECTN